MAALSSLAGTTDLYALLPPVWPAAALLAGTAAIAVALVAAPRIAVHGLCGRLLAIAGALLVAATLWLLWKQAFQIGDGARFERLGLIERAMLTSMVLVAGVALVERAPAGLLHRWGWALIWLAAARWLWFDVLLLNPLAVSQSFGSLPVLNAPMIYFALLPALFWLIAERLDGGRLMMAVMSAREKEDPAQVRVSQALRLGAMAAMLFALVLAVRQVAHGPIIAGMPLGQAESLGLSGALLAAGVAWLLAGVMRQHGPPRVAALLRIAGLLLLVAATLKVFLVDAAVLTGLLRVASFVGLGLALIGIGWLYRRG
jgi:hypothetical protein